MGSTSLGTAADGGCRDFRSASGFLGEGPILFSALAWADVLLTLDSADFGEFLGTSFYGMPVLRPGQFLRSERAAGRLREQI
jgi:hypothetical protein